MLAPIALFVYNRPMHAERVLEALRNNKEAAASDLFIYSDAPRGKAALQAVSAVRELIGKVHGFNSVTVIEQEINLGISQSIVSGVTDLTARFGKVVVLEDDVLPSKYFLQYMNDGLEMFRDVEEVVSIHAYVYPIRQVLPETFFLRGADCWGWGTWKRGWETYESDGRKLLAEIHARGLAMEFDLGESYPYTKMLEDQINGKNDSWAVRWHASAFLRGQFTLYPGSSQVQSIGADGSGANVGKTSVFSHGKWGERVNVLPIPLEESLDARRAFAEYLRVLTSSRSRRLLERISRLLGR